MFAVVSFYDMAHALPGRLVIKIELFYQSGLIIPVEQ